MGGEDWQPRDPWDAPWHRRLVLLVKDCLVPLLALAWIGLAGGARLAARSVANWHQSLDSDTWRWSWPARIFFFVPGVAVPIFCFISAAGRTRFIGSGPWQSGEWQTYAWLLLEPRPASAFFPHLAYSMVCLTLLLVNPARFSRYVVVRFGIYAGVLLSLQYMVIVYFPDSFRPLHSVGLFAFVTGISIAGAAVPFAAIWLVIWLVKTRGGWSDARASFSVLGVVVVVGMFRGFESLIGLALICGTAWALGAYGIMSLYLLRYTRQVRFQFSLLRLMGFASWLAAYLGSWRISVDLMLQEYATLPTTRPGCYVCTAAARGHARIVGSGTIVLSSGERCRVNDQMRRLKAAELVLQYTAPAAHRACRAVYDRLGPPLARCLIHPLLADAAYLAMKPAEWTARLSLALLLPGGRRSVERLYR